MKLRYFFHESCGKKENSNSNGVCVSLSIKTVIVSIQPGRFDETKSSAAPNVDENDDQEKTVDENGETNDVDSLFAHNQKTNFEHRTWSIWTDFSCFEVHDATKNYLSSGKC